MHFYHKSVTVSQIILHFHNFIQISSSHVNHRQREKNKSIMDFEQIENQDGVRFSWNVWPVAKQDANKLVVPISCLYTPLKERPYSPVSYEPIVCRASPCRGVLNPFSPIDLDSKFWVCPFCLQRNPFPPHYKDIGPQSLPAELLAAYTTIEYVLPKPQTVPPIILFLVDTCLQDMKELKALRQSLTIALSSIPPNCLIGLITFGKYVHVHELGFEAIPKSYVFRGSKDYTQAQVQEALNIGVVSGNAPNQYRFLVPCSNCEFTLSQLFETLQADPWPVDSDKRPERATGVALSIAASLLETAFPSCGGRVISFIGGPCTIGPGTVVGVPLKEAIRSHHDIVTERSKHEKKASTFYESIARRLSNNGHVADILVGCLDQVGIAEMKSLANYTGGIIAMAESFDTNIYRQAVQRIFLKDANGTLTMAFNATTDVVVSRELRVCGLIGPAVSLNKKNSMVSDTEIGYGGSHAWKSSVITPKTTHALYFEVVGSGPANPQSRGIVQFITTYQHSSGQNRMRVTTVARSMVDGDGSDVRSSFDQEAAAALIARIAVFKCEIDDSPDVLRWLDRLLIRICQKYGEYRKEDPSSFTLNPLFSLYPQFMFYLRRSQFLSVVNNSPDETAFYRLVLISNHQ